MLRVDGVASKIAAKSSVLFFPLSLRFLGDLKYRDEDEEEDTTRRRSNSPLLLDKDPACLYIVWNHRHEFDKNPDLFVNTMVELAEEGLTNFQLILLGDDFGIGCEDDNKEEEKEGREKHKPFFSQEQHRTLAPHILHSGYCQDKQSYYEWLSIGDVAISCAIHEFYGVSMIL